MNGKWSISCNVENIGVPVDIYFLSDVGEIKFNVNQVGGVVISDVRGFEVVKELVDERSTIQGKLLVEEVSWGGKQHLRYIRSVEGSYEEQGHN